MNWFWKTLTGYRVVQASLNKEVMFIHRPFRRPIIKVLKKGSTNRLQHSGIVIDEVFVLKPLRRI